MRQALRAYPGQAAVLGSVCFVLAAIGLAAPAYARLASAQLRQAQVAAATPVERTVTVRADDVFDEQGDRGKMDRAAAKLRADADGAGLTEFAWPSPRPWRTSWPLVRPTAASRRSARP